MWLLIHAGIEVKPWLLLVQLIPGGLFGWGPLNQTAADYLYIGPLRNQQIWSNM